MRAFNLALPFGVLTFAAGCSGSFTEIGQGTGNGGMGAAAGMAGLGSSGSAGLGTGGSGASAGMAASGGSGADAGNGGSGAKAGKGGKGGAGGKGGNGAGGSSGNGVTGGSTSSGGLGATGGGSGNGGSGGMGGYYPCAGKSCGNECTLCDPNDATCVNDNLVRRCDPSGSCSADKVICPSPGTCSTSSDCLITGELTVTPCPDGTGAPTQYECIEGQCSYVFPGCLSHDSCQNGACGDPCAAPCTGGPGNCVAPAAYCDANLTCQIGSAPVCPVTACTSDTDCATGYICVDQIGGAGNPAGRQCARQLACPSVAPCSCIQNEGTCTYVDGTPSYCQCDNGIR